MTKRGEVSETCVCGHVLDEHGQDHEYPGSSSCNIDGCACISFEKEEEHRPEAGEDSADEVRTILGQTAREGA